MSHERFDIGSEINVSRVGFVVKRSGMIINSCGWVEGTLNLKITEIVSANYVNSLKLLLFQGAGYKMLRHIIEVFQVGLIV